MTKNSNNSSDPRNALKATRQRQQDWAAEAGTRHENGYCLSCEDNLPWLTERIRDEVNRGDGAEFGKPGARARISALHSSAALSVNLFGYWHECDRAPLQHALQLGNAIVRIQFERKFPTGVPPRSPNIDVTLELADGSLVAIECKFTEWLGASGRKALRGAYLPKGKQRWSSVGLLSAQKAAESYMATPGFARLDVPQLLKHMLGLASQSQPWKLVLLWYDQSGIESKKMQEEITHFKRLLGRDAEYFSSVTYQELWERLAPVLSSSDRNYGDYLSARYF